MVSARSVASVFGGWEESLSLDLPDLRCGDCLVAAMRCRSSAEKQSRKALLFGDSVAAIVILHLSLRDHVAHVGLFC